MPRKIFFSFHYDNDSWRASKIRNIGVIEGNPPASDNKWEEVKKGGEKAIQKWIDDSLEGRTCTIVLVGSKTADRKWIKYEIQKSWENGMGVFGICIHNVTDSKDKACEKGRNPFDEFTFGEGKFSDVVKLYDPPYTASKDVYKYISDNMTKWIEDAIKIRAKY